jgi:hypothetical protein
MDLMEYFQDIDFHARLLKVKEFRLMADNQYCFAEKDILLALGFFSNLKKLGLAHILLGVGRWESLLGRLWPWTLERLWLMDPRHIDMDVVSGKYLMTKYEGDESMEGAADDVRLIDTGSLWTATDEPPRTMDFEYPGFAIFERI